MVVKAYTWFCTPGSPQAGLRGTYWVLMIEPRLCKVSILTSVLSLWPPQHFFYKVCDYISVHISKV